MAMLKVRQGQVAQLSGAEYQQTLPSSSSGFF
jgi:hypothetical protein